ncbi:MAG TPA: hypothetical protein VNF47_13510 [Streptosporangiaceae bacterium]|nr:hypothetical protein [Streptosporangiaceae bacterium]
MSPIHSQLFSFSRASLLGAALTIVTLAGGIVSAAAAPAAAAPAAPAGFGVSQPASDSLSGVSCVRASFCMAVGGYTGGRGSRRPLVEKWNGRRWRVLNSPVRGGLSDVSCTSASFCMAIGAGSEVWNGRTWRVLRTGSGMSSLSCTSARFCMAVGSAGPSITSNVSEKWNGRSWRMLSTPDPRCDQLCVLSSVACVSARFCIAVGSSGTGESELDPVALAWNGTAWRDTRPLGAGAFAELAGVSCTGSGNCVAVGSYSTADAPPCSDFCVLAEKWNGSTWQQLAAPVAAAAQSVSCTRATSCVEVGGTQSLAWNGTTWRQLTVRAPGEKGSVLSAISCWRASACMATGNYTTAAGAQLTLAEEWNGGRAWQVRRTPSPGDAANGLSGVSCWRASECMAVGSYISRSDARVTLAEELGGRSWRVRATPSPGAQVSELSAVSCPAAAQCIAVGSYDTASSPQILAEKWNGHRWQVLPAGHPGVLTDVACRTVSSCTAVGSYLDLSGTRLTLAETWDGSSWQEQVTPVTGVHASELSGISCTSASTCVAVGVETRTSGLHMPLAEKWDGGTWQLLAAPPSPGGHGALTSVSCPRPSACMVVGAMHGLTFADSWNGSAWQARATPVPPGGLRNGNLAAVSCVRSGLCRAVGGYLAQSGSTFALAEAWNGTRWSLMKTPGSSPAFSDLYDISCTLAFRCVAVGETATQRTLAESWNGTRWELMITPSP